VTLDEQADAEERSWYHSPRPSPYESPSGAERRRRQLNTLIELMREAVPEED